MHESVACFDGTAGALLAFAVAYVFVVGLTSNQVAAPCEGGHVGIRNVRRRLEAYGGTRLTIQSAPGKGCVATARIPKEGLKR